MKQISIAEDNDVALDPYMNLHEKSLCPPELITNPNGVYHSSTRAWQGIPTIEAAGIGNMFCAWYTGGKGEGVGNHVVLVRSSDSGSTWSDPVLIVKPNDGCRQFDPLLWKDPEGRLWLFWAQSYGPHCHYNGRGGVWFTRCDAPDRQELKWITPKRICDGVMMNKPTVLASGSWLLPVSIWGHGNHKLPELDGMRCPLAVISRDSGKSWQLRGMAEVADNVRTFDEHMIVERKDNSLWMLIRTKYGIGQSESIDEGKTWNFCKPSGLTGVDSRFFIRRSSTGRILLVSNNDGAMERRNMTAFVSEDDGKTWIGGLLLDARNRVSYPDGVEVEEGRWAVVYDRERNDNWMPDKNLAQGAGEILMADFTEDDVLNGGIVGDKSRFMVTVDRLH